MKKTRILVIALIVLTTVFTSSVAYASSEASRNFIATLSGAAERPDPRDTNARGVTHFKLSKDGTELAYKLIVANIENVFAAHIHCGGEEVAGPVGVTLFVGTPGGGRFSGVLAEGTITGPDAVNNCGWETLDDVVAAMLSGDAYVNVHTNDTVAPPNTGPGDFPGGEIRGQIR
ncbi:MAG TPA: CHRD domain-containing protein [Anaerolineales bacterium]|nr:CHRD domain-containing protein [Anaerolineales bacterium]